jgi:hypothetical protein
MTEAEEVRIQMDAFDAADLEESVPGVSIQAGKPDEALGEPVTIILLIITPLVIKALANWLLKNRSRREFSWEYEKRSGDDVIRGTIKVKVSDSDTLADVVKQVNDGLTVDPATAKLTLAT